MNKVCKGCKEEKSIDLFGVSNRHLDGRLSKCKECLRDYKNAIARRYLEAHRQEIILKKRLKRKGTIELDDRIPVIKGATEKPCKTCKKVYPLTEFSKNKKNPDGKGIFCFECRQKQWLEKIKNPEFVQKNRIRLNALQKKKASTPQGRIDARLSNAIWYTLKGKKSFRHWYDIVGYTAQELKDHLQSLFTEGMTWELFLAGEIHIDHKIPKSWFKYESEYDEEFKKCWALSNLQPLWKTENLRKHNSYAHY